MPRARRVTIDDHRHNAGTAVLFAAHDSSTRQPVETESAFYAAMRELISRS